MKISLYYLHTDGERRELNLSRKEKKDEAQFVFFPEEGETLPFAEQSVPYAMLPAWLSEIDDLYDVLAETADNEYNDLMSTI